MQLEYFLQIQNQSSYFDERWVEGQKTCPSPLLANDVEWTKCVTSVSLITIHKQPHGHRVALQFNIKSRDTLFS